MFSVSVSEERGFGFKLLQTEVDKVNNHSSWSNRSKLKFDEKTPYGSPALISFKYGVAREGYWNHEHFMNQCETFIAMFDILYPYRQLYYEVNWSSGHAKMKDDGWNVGKMNVRFGGKQQPTMKDSILLPGCVGPNSLLKVGDTQEFTFREGGLLPMNKNAKKEDHEVE